MGSANADHILVVVGDGKTLCSAKDGQFCAVTTPAGSTTKSGACFQMQCDELNRMKISVGGVSKSCGKAGTSLSFAGYKGVITCPDPMVVCGIARYPVTPCPGPARGRRVLEANSTDGADDDDDDGAFELGNQGCPAVPEDSKPSPSPGMSGTVRASPTPFELEFREEAKIIELEPTDALVLINGSGTIHFTDGTGAIQPLILKDLVVVPGSEVKGGQLRIKSSLDLTGKSVLSPLSDNDKIELDDKQVEIVIRAREEDFPRLNLGEIGDEYKILPKSVEIDCSVAHLVGDGTWTLIEGNSLSNCAEWLGYVNFTNVPSGGGQLTAECQKPGSARRIRAAGGQVSLLARYAVESKESRTPKKYAGLELGAWTGIGVSAVVCIAICIVVAIYCWRLKGKRDENECEDIPS
jgi:hypothetical protein